MAGRAQGRPEPTGIDHAGGDPSAAAAGLSAGLGGLTDWLRERRNRLIARRRFRHAAARFPLTRPLAQRQARALFDLCAGFVYAQILQACVALAIFQRLADGPKSAAAIGAETGLSAAAADRLLAGAASLGLLERRRGGRYGLSMLGATVHGDAGIRAMVAHHTMLYRDLADPVALLKGDVAETALGRFWSYAGGASGAAGPSADTAAYSDLMAASQDMILAEVVDAYPFERHSHLLDVGGGAGRFACGVAEAAPKLRLTVFDLPTVADRAAEAVAEAGLSGRIATEGGDFTRQALPAGFDLVTLVRVVHDHDDAAAQALLDRVYAALPPGGVLLVAEPMAQTPGVDPVGDAYFGFYLLAMGSGRPRTKARLSAMIRAAGFERVREHKTRQPMIVRVLGAQKPL